MSERIFDGRQAFEELLGGGHFSDVAVATTRVCTDAGLMKIAEGLSPHDPASAYERLGGGYITTGLKLAAAPKLVGGLKSDVHLFGHQQEAVDKILAKDGNLLLSHPVGSGKTLTSIAAFEALRTAGKAERALVVAPASLRTNFVENGVKRFTNSTAAIFGNAQEASQGTHVTAEKPDSKAQYHVVSYELFRANPKKYIDAARADTVIYDELHRAKNEGVLTSKAIREARQYHRNFIGMTGSIVSNSPADIVPLVDAMTDGKHLLGNKTTFESRFVQHKDDGGKSLKNPQVLRSLLAPYIHHVDAATLNTKAPTKTIEEIRVDMSPHQTQLYRFLTNQLDPITKLKLKAGVSSLNSAELNNLFAKLIRLRQVSNAVHTLDTKVTLDESARDTPKINRILNDVEDHIHETPDAQVVIHTNLVHGGVDVLTAGLTARGIDHAIFIGKGNAGITEKGRQQGVKEYQEGKKKVIVLSAAGGEGLDLPNTTFMAMADGHFNPERINQAEARGVRAGGQAHRAVENRNVLVRRYVSVLPKDIGHKVEVLKNIWDNINPVAIKDRVVAGSSAFFNPFKKEPSTDEWVYSIAKRKGLLNTDLHGALKHASAPMPVTTHEELEDCYTEIAKIAGWSPSKSGLVGAGVGAVAGAGYGLFAGGTAPRSKREAQLDPGAVTRNRLSSMAGGTLVGAISGYQAARMAHEDLNPGALMGTMANFAYGPLAGRNVADLFAPARTVPKSVQDLLGKDRKRYSDKALFEKYWEKFGPELETQGQGVDVKDKALEAKFVAGLRDLYQEASTVKPSFLESQVRSSPGRGKESVLPSKKRFLIEHGLAAALVPILSGVGTGLLVAGKNMVKEVATTRTLEEAVAKGKMRASDANEVLRTLKDGKLSPFGHGILAALPIAVGASASLAKGYRDLYIDPGVESSSSKSDTRKRAKFSDEQLQMLLRGGNVDEIKTKSHFIK